MSKSKMVYPMAFKPNQALSQGCWYVAFPFEWKEKLLAIRDKKAGGKDGFKYLSNKDLKKLILWLPDLTKMNPLGPSKTNKPEKEDEKWLTFLKEPTENTISELTELIKLWMELTFTIDHEDHEASKGLDDSTIMTINSELSDLINEVSTERLMQGVKQSELALFDEQGNALRDAFSVYPYLVVSRLVGKDITVGGQTLHLCYEQSDVGNGREMITHPFTYVNKDGQRFDYSYVFNFSLVTVPPESETLLICHVSTRRWIPGCDDKERGPYFEDSIKAKIKVDEDTYCEVPVMMGKREDGSRYYYWNKAEKRTYEALTFKLLPEGDKVIKEPEQFREKIMLPYRNGMESQGFLDTEVGVGVPFTEKAQVMDALRLLLADLVTDELVTAEAVISQQTKPATFAEPSAYGADKRAFREWFRNCSEASHITFELYGNLEEPAQKKILDTAKEMIEADFGPNDDTVPFAIDVRLVESGDLSREIPGVKKKGKVVVGANEKRKHHAYLKNEIGGFNEGSGHIAGALCMILTPKDYRKRGKAKYCDPKGILRNAFALNDRVVQFIHPLETNDASLTEKDLLRVRNAILDLYRHLGVMTLKRPNMEHNQKVQVFKAPCLGVHRINMVKAKYKRSGGGIQSVPLFVEYDFMTGKTVVYCELFKKKRCNYREACLEMARLYFDLDASVRVSSRSVGEILEERKRTYYGANNEYIVMVESNKEMAAIWAGVSDKAIKEYDHVGRFRPKRINVAGKDAEPWMVSFENTGIRIVRIRGNEQVPDYYTGLSEQNKKEDEVKFAESSGIFRYHDIFWMIASRGKFDPRFLSSTKEYKSKSTETNFLENDMIELYPVLLQEGDKAEDYLKVVNGLRYAATQYNAQATRLPLPLHLAKGLEEYLFDA